ncbi:L-type lectin-domain containing receptor kinase VIII.2-like [Cornus florida]|uniref:L-type lectin-domain containing receptor kinase VIII.2-like n=1 Tax=Cornus florida TaxID=4283 RepID=UPI00289C2721|nr:L-type lectin-domain containing receptor kinase VIII.2-like [Cornus florida]
MNLYQLICSFILITLVLKHPIPVESAEKSRLNNGPVINVTKFISFPDFSPNNPRINHDLKLLGSAIFSNGKGCIQIPDIISQRVLDLRHLAGRALYSSPIRLFDPISETPASFHTTFSFQFNSILNSTNSELNTTGGATSGGVGGGGSGLTFIIVPDEFTVGRPGPWLGMLNDVCDDEYKAVAVEFDTHWNPEFGDPNDNHVGINLGSIVSTTTINASDVGVQLNDGSVHRAWIEYDGRRRYMEVRLGHDGEDYPSKPVFSGSLDLSSFLKEYMFVGFSASTGNFTQIHNVLSWNFTSTSQAFLRVPSPETCESKIIVQGLENDRNTHNKPLSTSFMIFLAAVVLLIFVLLNLYYNRKPKNSKSNDVPVILPEKKLRPSPPNKPRRFTIAEISTATWCFSELQKLGCDSRSVTYRGTSLNGCPLVMKRFSTQFVNSVGSDKRRVAKEIGAMSRVRHPNLVPIRGWCYDNRETIVVYDYFSNGSLDKWLFGVGVLPWTRRFKVVKDVAESLSYVHSKQLAHKNVKTSSVFLDVSFRAALGDYGFVLSSTESTRFESAVSQKADVFDFGVFVLEVVAGRKRSDPGEPDLLEWAWTMHEGGEKVEVVDRRMGSVVNPEQAVRVVDIGLLCTLNENKGRPCMEEVVRFLNSESPVPELPPTRPISLFPYSSTGGLCIGYSCVPFK